MKVISKFTIRVLVSANLLLTAIVSLTASPTLEDFGYQTMRVNGQLAAGNRPLVVVLIRFASMDFPTNYFGDYFVTNIFDLFGPQTVNGFMSENSNGRFYWSRVGHPGVIRPNPLPDAENYGPTLSRVGGDPTPGATNPPGITALADHLFHSNLVARAMMSGLVDFSRFDTDTNSVVTGDELHLLFMLPDSTNANGAARSPGRVQPPGFSYAIHLELDAGVNVRSGFDLLTHELAHTLGAFDLYGATFASCGLTLMSCSDGTLDGRRTYHLDPWHKLKLGWCEPRIRSIRDGGVETLFAAQMIRPDAQVILSDPSRGASEYFILEYRTAISSNGQGYDRNITGNGLVIWHIKQGEPPPNLPGVFSEGAPNLAPGGNAVWVSNATTPYLRWSDGCSLSGRIHVRPFVTGASSITVEILPEPETWVAFDFTGPLEIGTFDQPYNTLAEGIANVPWAGFLKVKPGSTPERLTITKAVTIESCAGLVSIGRP